MPTYTLVTTRASGGSSTYVVDYADDASVISDAKQVLDEVIISVAIARDADVSRAWLGQWDLLEGEPRWSGSERAPLASAAPWRSGPHLVYRRRG